MKAAVFLFFGLFVALTANASAACSADMRYHINLGLSFLKEAQAYDRRDEKLLADAEWENVGHQVELIDDDILNCDDQPVNRDYYLLASWDSLHPAFRSADPDVLRTAASSLRGRVSLLYEYGGATYYRADYIVLKAAVRALYDVAHVPYCSPETIAKKCDALELADSKRRKAQERYDRERKASQARVAQAQKTTQESASKAREACTRDASVLNLRIPEYPANLRGSGLTASVTIGITIDPEGKVADSAVYADPFTGPNSVTINQAFEKAALEAARASTFTPRVSECHAVQSTIWLPFSVRP